MYKRITLFLLAILPVTASAYDAVLINDIFYYLFPDTKEAEVTSDPDQYTYTGDVVIPATVTYNGVTYNVTSIGDYAFSESSYLNSVTIPNGVTRIGDIAFSGCKRLNFIGIPESVTSIGAYAFDGCNLYSISIPYSVKSIGIFAFRNNTNMHTVMSFIEEPFKINENVFYNSETENHFTNAGLLVPYGLKEKYEATPAWNEFKKITEIQKLIGEKIDGVYYNLDFVNNEAQVTSLTGGSYYGQNSYSGNVTIPTSVTFGTYEFSVTSIGNDAFAECPDLISVTIPNSVTSIDANAFAGCPNLASVTSFITEPFAINDNVFSTNGVFTTATLYVPKGTKAKYEATDGWKNFSPNIVEMEDEPTPDIQRNVVMEQLTGAWCGYCIRGFVGMKQAKEQFGDRFIGIAVHGSDVMALGSYFDLGLNSYPSCRVDRDGRDYDPYDMSSIRSRMDVAPTVGVSVRGVWNDDKSAVSATSETQFLADGDGYSVAYVLVADGLTGTSSKWNQRNYYSGNTYSDPDLQAYCDMGSTITDMVYDDVMVGSSYDSSGQNLASPFSGVMKKGDKKVNSYTLSLPATGELAEAIDKNQVYVVAIVTNPDGTIANAGKAKVTNGMKGDVNGDGAVDVADIATIIDVMAKGTNDLIADVNDDKTVDVADISNVIDIMAGK